MNGYSNCASIADFRVGVEAPLFHVANHAHDFGLHIEEREIDALADGIFVEEIGAGENVIDLDHYGRACSSSCGVMKRPRSSVTPIACWKPASTR